MSCNQSAACKLSQILLANRKMVQLSFAACAASFRATFRGILTYHSQSQLLQTKLPSKFSIQTLPSVSRNKEKVNESKQRRKLKVRTRQTKLETQTTSVKQRRTKEKSENDAYIRACTRVCPSVKVKLLRFKPTSETANMQTEMCRYNTDRTEGRDRKNNRNKTDRGIGIVKK